MVVAISILTLTINSDIDSSGCTIWNCPLGSQASGDKDSQSSASAPPWTSLGAKAGVKSGVWFRCVFSWFVLGGLSLENHVFVCALLCKARCTCTCCLVFGDMFRLEDVSAMVFVNTCKCGTGLASMCLTCICTTLYAMIDVIALFSNSWWLVQCFLAPPDVFMMLAFMCWTQTHKHNQMSLKSCMSSQLSYFPGTGCYLKWQKPWQAGGRGGCVNWCVYLTFVQVLLWALSCNTKSWRLPLYDTWLPYCSNTIVSDLWLCRWLFGLRLYITHGTVVYIAHVG